VPKEAAPKTSTNGVLQDLSDRSRDLQVPFSEALPCLASPNIAIKKTRQFIANCEAQQRSSRNLHIATMASPLLAARAARKAAFNVAGKRFLSDISITRTGKPIMRVEGGR
jgi:hypothetical protein